MNIELSEIIYASDYDEYAPKTYLGHLLFASAAQTSTFETTKPSGMVSNVVASSEFTRSVEAVRGLTASAVAKSTFTVWIQRLDVIITDPGFTPSERQSAGTFDLPAISGGPPAFDFGDLPGIYTFTLESTIRALTLKTPEMGNSDQYKPDRILDENPHRLLRVKKLRDSGDGFSTLTYTFKNLLQAEMEELKTFLVESAGMVLTITEHSGKVWYAVCTTEDPTFTEELEQRYQITLTFETVP